MKTKVAFRTLSAIKRVAMNVNPLVIKKNKLIAKISDMQQEVTLLEKEIEGHEMGIMALTGGYKSEQLVTKKVTKLDKTDKEGKPLTKTEYIPTDLVTIDEENKCIYIGVDDEPVVAEMPEMGNDFDADTEKLAETASDELISGVGVTTIDTL